MSQTQHRPGTSAEPAGSRGRTYETWPAGWARLSPWQVWTLIVACGGALTLVVLVGMLMLVHRGETLPGITVEGVDVGGLGHGPARVALAELVRSRQRDPIVFRHGEREFVFSPGPDIYAAHVDEALAAAFRVGRTGNLLADAWAHAVALWQRPNEIDLPYDIALQHVHAWVSEVAATLDREPFPGRVRAEARTGKVIAEPPRPGKRVKREEAVDAALAAITTAGADRLELQVDVVDPRVTEGEVQRLAGVAARALAAPLTLTTPRAPIVLEPSKIARLIASRVVPGEGESDSLALSVPVEAVEEVFAPELDRINVEPRDATFEVLSPPVIFDVKGNATWVPQPAQLRLVPSTTGVRLDARLTAAQLERLLVEGRRTAELELAPVDPELTSEQAQSIGINQLIGTFTTYHQCCQPRVRNIHLVADMVRGAVIRPGETFSVNGQVGRRTRGRGFVEAGVIIKGELQDAVGGGVSQFATTTYNAAFFAGLPIVESKAHSLYISRYPMGREATLDYGGIDLKFRNDTDHGVFVHTSYTGTSITVSLYGNNGGRVVTAELGPPHNFHRTSEGKRGFDVEFSRTIDHGRGRVERQRFLTRYDG